MVCDGCCCGRLEKGNDVVPIDMLKSAWEEHGLKEHVKLSISGYIGSMQYEERLTDDGWKRSHLAW